MSRRRLVLNRRDFLKLFPTVLGSTILACNKVEQRAGGPPTLSPTAPPTLEPGTFAETIFVNGKVVNIESTLGARDIPYPIRVFVDKPSRSVANRIPSTLCVSYRSSS